MNVKYGAFLLDAAAGAGAAAPADGAAAPAAPAVAGGNAAPGAAPADGSPSGGAASPGSLLARGAGAPSAGASAAPAPAADGGAATIPEKYLVKREDGTTDYEASALKQAAGYAALAKRLGTGDAPPKDPDSYTPEMPAGMTLEALKADPLWHGFLKGAHSRGMTNAQVSYVLDAYTQRMAPNSEAAEAELRNDFPTDAQLQAALGQSYRATKAYAGSDEAFKKLEAKFGSDPDFIRFAARVGKDLGEDRPPVGLSSAEADTLESLLGHPGYMDSKHPEHKQIVAKARAMYAKKYGEA